MSIDFVIIPISDDFMDYCEKINTRLSNVSSVTVCVKIDESFNRPLQDRINYWLEQSAEYEIITVGRKECQNETINVRWSGETKSKTINLDVFIDTVSSFELDDNEKDTDNNNACVIN